MFPTDLADLARVLGLEPPGRNPPVTGISKDTRALRPGDLYVALTGDRFDGHAFAPQAARAGAAGALADPDRLPVETPEGLPILASSDPLASLQALGGEARRRFTGPVAAITGSHGKTTVKELLAGLLASRDPVVATPGNLNGQIGVPLTLLELTDRAWAGVVEVGISMPGEMERLAPLVRPGAAAVLNVAPVHTEFLGDVAAVAREKLKLLDALPAEGVAILPAEEPRLEAPRHPGRIWTFGVERPADFRAEDIRPEPAGGYAFRLVTPEGAFPTRLGLPGRHNVDNALAAVALAAGLGFPARDAAELLPELQGAPMRMVLEERRGVRILNDAYNAAPRSMEAALRTLVEVADGPTLAVLGDMLELGDGGPAHHRDLGRRVAEHGIDHLMATGPLSVETVAGAREAGMPPDQARHYSDRSEMAQAIRALLAPGWTLLVKGSRGLAMEQVLAEALPVGG